MIDLWRKLAELVRDPRKFGAHCPHFTRGHPRAHPLRVSRRGPRRPRSCTGARPIAATVSDALFILLIVVNVIRTLRHAMWRDELQIFMLALYSSSPWSLLLKLKYEAHPGLWYMLVWVITRVTSDPMWMQVMHIGLAIGVWIIIYWWSPFSRLEKILLLLSYFLFWEYFVISRNYVLIALIAFAFIALRERRPRPEFILWLLLGLLANVHVFGAIWSMVLAAMLAMEGVRRRSVPIAGAAVYLILLVFAIATMVPAADFGPWAHDVRFSVSRLNADLTVPFGAFVPLRPDSIRDAVAFIAHPETASIPQFWNSNPTDDFVALTHADTDHPVRLALVFAVPIAACWLIARDPLLVLEFTLVYLGIVLFANIWDFPGSRPPSRRRIFSLDCFGVDGTLTSFACHLVVLGVEGASYRQRLRWRADACFRTEAIFRRIQCRCLDKAKQSCGYFSHRIA